MGSAIRVAIQLLEEFWKMPFEGKLLFIIPTVIVVSLIIWKEERNKNKIWNKK